MKAWEGKIKDVNIPQYVVLHVRMEALLCL